MVIARPEQTLYGRPGCPRSRIIWYARTVSRTSVRSRRASRLPTEISGAQRPSSMSAMRRAKPEATKCGSWRGPMWLNGRAIVTVSTPFDFTPSISCASLLSPYGLDGRSG